jgi:hypothetical protein
VSQRFFEGPSHQRDIVAAIERPGEGRQQLGERLPSIALPRRVTKHGPGLRARSKRRHIVTPSWCDGAETKLSANARGGVSLENAVKISDLWRHLKSPAG